MATSFFRHFSYYFFNLSSSGLRPWLKATSECIFCFAMTSILFSITIHAKRIDQLDMCERDQFEICCVLICFKYIFIPPENFVCGGYILFSRCASIRSILFPYYLEESSLDFHQTLQTCSYICKTNTLNKKVRARGKFYMSYFPL